MLKIRAVRSPAFWVISIAILIAIVTNVANQEGFMNQSATWAGDRPSLSAMSNEISLIREGTVMADVRGRFRVANDRMTFTDEATNKTYLCLENLMLQRIYSTIKDDDRKITWVISAKATEYNGDNFLFLDKAVKSR